jgi:hypothetical protein
VIFLNFGSAETANSPVHRRRKNRDDFFMEGMRLKDFR